MTVKTAEVIRNVLLIRDVKRHPEEARKPITEDIGRVARRDYDCLWFKVMSYE
jgi:hypothetical protein